MRIVMRMLEIVKKIVIVVFIMVMTLVGSVLFSALYYTDSNRNYAAAIGNVKHIHAGELEAKSKYGKYLSLKKLVAKELVSPGLIDGEHLGYKFEVKLTEDDFAIIAVPKNKGESVISITMKSNGKILVTRSYTESYWY